MTNSEPLPALIVGNACGGGNINSAQRSNEEIRGTNCFPFFKGA